MSKSEIHNFIRLIPILKQRIWGGRRLATDFTKKSSQDQIGESWEVSDLKEDVSVVASGVFEGKTLKEVIQKHKNQFLGNAVFEKFGANFPIIVKFIDAHLPLSIQVHPNDDLAKQRYNTFGKNELWYVVDAYVNSEIITGFSEPTTQQEFEQKIGSDNFLDLFKKEKIISNDAYFIPAGSVHAIGAGSLILEIQQASDITYRIYDYDRTDAETGMKRTLQLSKAMGAIIFEQTTSRKIKYKANENGVSKLIDTPYFTTNLLQIKGESFRNLKGIDSFVIYVCVEGEATLAIENSKTKITKGETILLPAVVEQCWFSGSDAKIVEVYVNTQIPV